MQRALTILTNSLSSGICIKPDKNWNQPQIPTADLCIPATSSLQTPKRLLLVAHGESQNPTSSVSRTEQSAQQTKETQRPPFPAHSHPLNWGGGAQRLPGTSSQLHAGICSAGRPFPSSAPSPATTAKMLGASWRAVGTEGKRHFHTPPASSLVRSRALI